MQWMHMLWTFLPVKYGYVFAITCRMSDTIFQFFWKVFSISKQTNIKIWKCSEYGWLWWIYKRILEYNKLGELCNTFNLTNLIKLANLLEIVITLIHYFQQINLFLLKFSKTNVSKTNNDKLIIIFFKTI